MTIDHVSPLTPQHAFDLLRVGNQRFVSHTHRNPVPGSDGRPATPKEKRLLATVFACSDAWLAPHILLDCGADDLYMVQTLAHRIGPAVLASIELALRAPLGCPLVVVMGHPACHAVTTARAAIKAGLPASGPLRRVIAPSILTACRSDFDDGELIDEHIRVTTELLLDRSSLLRAKVAAEQTGLVGLICDSEGEMRVLASYGLQEDLGLLPRKDQWNMIGLS